MKQGKKFKSRQTRVYKALLNLTNSLQSIIHGCEFTEIVGCQLFTIIYPASVYMQCNDLILHDVVSLKVHM